MNELDNRPDQVPVPATQESADQVTANNTADNVQTPQADAEEVKSAPEANDTDDAHASGAQTQPEAAAQSAAPEEESADETPAQHRKYNAMNRKQLLEALREIVNAGDMEAHKDVAAIKQAYYMLLNKEALDALAVFTESGNDPADFQTQPDADEHEIKQLFATFRERRAKHLEQLELEKLRNLEVKNNVIERLRALAEDIDNVNVRFPEFQQLQQEFKAAGEVPPGNDNEVWKNYQTAVEQFYDRLKLNKELRDLDFRKNLAIKTALIEKARELGSLEDPVDAFRRLQELHDQWRQTGPVAKEKRDEIWAEFKEASTVVNKRHQDFFQNRKAEESANEERKTLLCEQVEALDLTSLHTFADWDARTKEVMAIQKEYHDTGYAPRKTNAALFARFRKACDAFFAAKSEHFKKAKDELRENLAKKEELCKRAEALIEKAQEKGALEQLQAIQQEWRTVGVVRRKHGDEIWKRFCAAADAFHDARKKHFGAQRSAENDNLKAKQAIVAELREISEESERRDVIGRIRELQDKWQQIGFVPFKHKEAINTEFRKELNRLFGAFDNRDKGQRMKKFEGDLKKMGNDGSKLGRERERLLRSIETRQAELNTIQNNMGFFNIKSSAGNSMLKDFERKIERIKNEIAQIQDKIKLLDKQEKENTPKD